MITIIKLQNGFQYDLLISLNILKILQNFIIKYIKKKYILLCVLIK